MTMPILLTKTKKNTHFLLEIPVERFERFAEVCGLYGKEFLEHLAQAEDDVVHGRVKQLKSVADLMKKPRAQKKRT